MNVDQIRDTFVRFYSERDHLRIPSASLVPHGDPTLMFTGAGMVPFKPYFMGLAEPPSPRMVTVQKCFRTTNIEDVGDYSHLTLFEMLGNFSVGDYFKEGAIAYAWELLTKGFGLDPKKLCVSIFLTDDEAFDLWREVGLPIERIHRYDEEYNYWFSGDVGPCGPNSEIFVDRGPRDTCEFCRAGTCKPNLDDCGRFLEVWNLVFMTLYQAEDGTRTELPRKNIDTGSGLERVAVILQGKDTVYDTDAFRPIIARIEELSDRTYGQDPAQDKAMRVVADHVRAATFLISDGVMPSNEGRGYVLRRVLRRAVYFLTQISRRSDSALLDRIAEAVIEKVRGAYPDVGERGEFIRRLLASEESRFRETLERGRTHLDALLSRASKGSSIDGTQAFTLYDTYGYPLELTQEIAAERGLTVDYEGFDREMEAQRARGRAAAKFDYDADRLSAYTQLAHIRSQFVGYDQTEAETTIAAIIGPGGVTERAVAGEHVEVVLIRTPFYAEGGGQLGDAGEMVGPSGRIAIEDTQAAAEGLTVHRGRIIEGWIAVNDAVTARVDLEKRRASQRNHTATHLLHAALRQVLGAHVKQAGSLVAPDRLRFDFTHIEATKPKELGDVQRLVNEQIRANIDVHAHIESYDDAIAAGAMALFGEKYMARVRVVDICRPRRDAEPDCFSKELCGGTHCMRTGEIGAFVIESESSIGSGLRRIEALTGALADTHILRQHDLLARIGRRLNAAPSEIEGRLDATLHELESERRRAQQYERMAGRAQADALVDAAERVNGAAVLIARVPAGSTEAMREMGDQLRDRLGSSVVVLGALVGDRPSFLAMVSKDLTSRVHAGNLIRDVAAVAGGGGGGRPDMAQAGGKDAGRLDDALARAGELARERLAG